MQPEVAKVDESTDEVESTRVGDTHRVEKLVRIMQQKSYVPSRGHSLSGLPPVAACAATGML
jgi:hypothetical protein